MWASEEIAPVWTDEDRAELRVYLIFIGRKLHLRFLSNLDYANDKFNEVASEIYRGNSTLTLYHNKRKLDNEITQIRSI